jgi:hypothetical protein
MMELWLAAETTCAQRHHNQARDGGVRSSVVRLKANLGTCVLPAASALEIENKTDSSVSSVSRPSLVSELAIRTERRSWEYQTWA